VAGAGDVNADGFADLLVGDPYYVCGGVGCGRALLFFGAATLDTTADAEFVGTSSDRMGYFLGGTGDVNADGYADMLLGRSAGAGGTSILYLGGTAPDAVPDLTLAGSGGRRLYKVAWSGDVNGDGFYDMLAGTSSFAADEAYLFLGGATPDPAPDVTYASTRSVQGAGDSNGDGFADILVGVQGTGAYLYFGASVVDGTPDAALTGASTTYSGAAAGVGDANGDGYADVVLGDPYGGTVCGSYRGGRAYLYLGGAAPHVVPDVTFSGSCTASSGDSLGIALASAQW
jgi:hypothetical protein